MTWSLLVQNISWYLQPKNGYLIPFDWYWLIHVTWYLLRYTCYLLPNTCNLKLFKIIFIDPFFLIIFARYSLPDSFLWYTLLTINCYLLPFNHCIFKISINHLVILNRIQVADQTGSNWFKMIKMVWNGCPFFKNSKIM